ncbi:MAG TPA: bacillithiol transferase BstA [Candidatus Dormibacteraeota bacterium]|nr:bacillithiol transferase BstA [Candidatus Dormibacteraeota bacterium]
MDNPDLRYPIGKFQRPSQPLTPDQRREFIGSIAETPDKLAAAIAGLTPAQFDTPYRPGGWTVRQVVHHLPDSHMNSYVRFKLALTEDEPTIKPYDEARWAELADSRETPIGTSLALLEHLHDRWVVLLRSFAPDDWSRTFRHPELGPVTLDQTLALYAWHGRHHVAHIAALRERNSWRKARVGFNG